MIRELSSRGRSSATLDESFVVSFAEPLRHVHHPRPDLADRRGHGRTKCWWSRSGRSAPSRSWIGEDIPVPYDVAKEVGRLRREEDYADYNGDASSVKAVREYLAEHRAKFPMPTDKKVTLEIGKRLAILNMCFGTKVNETLSKMLSILLTARLGESVGVTTDPYRIILDLPRDIKPDMIIETLKAIRSDTVEALVRMVIKNSQPPALALRLRGEEVRRGGEGRGLQERELRPAGRGVREQPDLRGGDRPGAVGGLRPGWYGGGRPPDRVGRPGVPGLRADPDRPGRAVAFEGTDHAAARRPLHTDGAEEAPGGGADAHVLPQLRLAMASPRARGARRPSPARSAAGT